MNSDFEFDSSTIDNQNITCSIEKLNELGFPSVIKMSNKITLVYEGDLESLAKRIFNE